MLRRCLPVLMCATAVVGGVGCSSSKATKSTGPTTTVGVAIKPPIGLTTPTTALGVTPTTLATTTVTTIAATGTATTVKGTPTTVAGGTATTVASRVVTKPSDNVRRGDTGSGVTQIQTALKAKGYNLTVDGKFGNQTEVAIRDFQKKNKLTQDGIVGPLTWAKLSGSSSTGATTTTVKSSTSTTVKTGSTTTSTTKP